ncbi:ABC transporter substrate-binding protein [Vibrio hannami]|uniref:ABC transporter substrate-binding protein n=1 Tax=Vibrio hannami TaxID=2717094 RepID=UPI00240FE35B|nr:ABC transporter substrate-binding protein [Vibrio hannami]MDG3088621.1 ABC transporter substrate-binding protein [Vibrio hannami]
MKQRTMKLFSIKRAPTAALSLIAALVSGYCLASDDFPPYTSENEVEVLHWWTSGGEARSAEILKNAVEKRGYDWKDFSVAGGGGESAMMVLKARAVSGNPPTSAQIKGYDIQEWSQLNFLSNVDDVAKKENWDSLLPKFVADIMKYKGQYVAAPANIHRVNLLWANKGIFNELNLAVPKTLDEFFEAAEVIKQAGYIPLAHGSQPWQDATLFEAVAIAVLGSEDYYKAFVKHYMDVLQGDKMVKVFEAFKKMRSYTDDKILGRDWNVATNMVINGEAAMQIMGDWAKGEFTVAGKFPGEDYVCTAAPGTAGKFAYNIDSFVFFKSHDPSRGIGQREVASAVMSKQFQQDFNFSKGSLPARNDVSIEKFDQCAKSSMKAFKQAEGSPDMLPSMSADMSTTSFVRAAILDVVNEFFMDADADPEKAAKRLARAIKAAM